MVSQLHLSISAVQKLTRGTGLCNLILNRLPFPILNEIENATLFLAYGREACDFLSGQD